MVEASHSNIAEFTVSELSLAIKKTIEGAFEQVRIRGELGRVSRPGSGHVYLDLKDQNAVISGVIWKGVANRLTIQPEQGLEVVATGRLTTFPGQSRYQIVIESLEPAGAGALMALLEERRKKLAAEGLFDAARKQLLPELPAVIGVVTSPTGAVIRDILHRISDRFPLHVLVWPVRVQGERSSAEVAAGIAGFNALPPSGVIPRPDVIIVARGGGSLEDLWGFNDEQLIRVAAQSNIPIVSAVGHETDWTLMDHVADHRAPTPTAAAEIIVPVRTDLLARVSSAQDRLFNATLRTIERHTTVLRAATRGLPRLDDLLDQPRQRLDLTAQRMGAAIARISARADSDLIRRSSRLSPRLIIDMIQRNQQQVATAARRIMVSFAHVHATQTSRVTAAGARLSPRQLVGQIEQCAERNSNLARRLAQTMEELLVTHAAGLAGHLRVLDALSYTAVLRRGFALVRQQSGAPLTSAAAAGRGDQVSIEFHDGRVEAAVLDGGGGPSEKPVSRPPKQKKRGQGELF